ncbi:flavin reductase family protein [Nocardioides bruguierae]|uniref:Flavin reductase family protein n=1 Tax=Nocardioides bruguierae TaxID=2945102 RepID=A0A9X2D9W2_9ACTN|nr:flavin reductase family protein [Nocardioides bruguierae]MCL8027667.1 flavin reductase family protein [Nocardioides bruguierae]MCM0621972.1 flavin reductase family protein [Nocardioides bruguierae]
MMQAVGDVTALRTSFSGFPCGVAALAAVVDGEQTVLVASSFTVGVSQDPPLVMFAVQKTSTTWPVLAEAEKIGVSILGETHAESTRQLASKDKSNRFAGLETHTTDEGAILLEKAPVWMECSVEHTYPAGDHDIIVLRVHNLRSDFDHAPLVWHRSAFAALAG